MVEVKVKINEKGKSEARQFIDKFFVMFKNYGFVGGEEVKIVIKKAE